MKLALERPPIRKVKLVSRVYKAGKDYRFPEVIDDFKQLKLYKATMICLDIYNETFDHLKGIKYPDFEMVYQLMNNYKKMKASVSGGTSLSHDELLKFLIDVTNLGSNFYNRDASLLLESHLKMKNTNF